jgi:hypothetical protein
MTEEQYAKRLEQAKDLADIYEIVKDAVRQVYKKSRPGMMLGLADLGEGANAWIGGYHVVASNAIIMNSRPLDYIKEHHPEYYKPYVFTILLHEYIHTLGVLDEEETRGRTLDVAEKTFGTHLVVEFARDIAKFIPYIQQVQYGWHPSQDPSIYYVMGFDKSSISYYI